MTTTDCQGTAWGDSSVEHKPQSYGNSPSGQHFCYTGVTAVDVACACIYIHIYVKYIHISVASRL